MLDTSRYALKKARTGYWEIRWTEQFGGKHRSKTHSTREAKRPQAETYLRHWLGAQKEIAAEISGVPTIAELARPYELNAKSRKVGPAQFINIKQIVDFFGHLRPTEITDEDVRDFRAFRGVADSTVRRNLNSLIAIMNFGVRKRLIEPGMIPHIDLPPESQPREVYLRPAEEKEFTDLLLQDPGSRMSRFSLLALRTGARRSAIEKLTWDRVDFSGNFVDYRDPEMTRTKKRRVPVPIDKLLLPVLQAAQIDQQDNFVIGAGPIRAVFENWRSAHPQFSHITAHALRHTAATRWLRNGMGVWDVAGLLGDTVETTTRVYGHHATADLRAAMG